MSLSFSDRQAWPNSVESVDPDNTADPASFGGIILFEPHDEKTCLGHMLTTKAQISLRIHTV